MITQSADQCSTDQPQSRKCTPHALYRQRGKEILWNQYTDSMGGVKFVHKTKKNYKDKNNTKCNNYTPVQSMQNIHTDTFGNKSRMTIIDKNL